MSYVKKKTGPAHGQYLDPKRLVPANETFSSIAEKVIEDKKGDLSRARALFNSKAHHGIDQQCVARSIRWSMSLIFRYLSGD